MDALFAPSITVTLSPADEALCADLVRLASDERHLQVELLYRLGDFDERRVYARLGYSSAFAYLAGELRLSEASAYRRLLGARLLRRMPGMADYLRDGRVTLKKVCLLSKVLTEENHFRLLDEASGLSEREVEALAARLDPNARPVRSRDSIRVVARAPVPQSDAKEEASRSGIAFRAESAVPAVAGASSPVEVAGARVFPALARWDASRSGEDAVLAARGGPGPPVPPRCDQS